MRTIELNPRQVVSWESGTRHEETATPEPFGAERAAAIWAQRLLQGAVEHAMTKPEVAYVYAVWDTMGGSSCWMSAFYAILNGQIEAEQAAYDSIE